jgi:LPXTG-site transpeptidase (sortase) family protein
VPVSVEVSAVNISAEVVPVGIADDGQMELPPHPDVIGWYRFGPTAGNGAGSVVLAGHVDSRKYGLGQFARIHESEVGDEVLVRTESGRDLRYTVVDVRSLPKAELPLADVFSREGHERLLLITCGGDFDRQQGYADNIVVTAVPA